ncbi:(S)-benzoin forming benzil reductase [Amphibacillus indicireducens]|uniref:(S)-benzoin forming benzil reductase n=1 Tax=Amphibacillus indicireducens TaxID=1076330 RepID=A0ABP7VW25_9BACI
MKYAIITGSSKGLGASTAKQLLKAGVHVVGIARETNDSLLQVAKETGATYQHFNCNLSDTNQLDRTFEKINDQVFKKDTELVYLINNAATVKPIDIATRLTSEAVQAHMQLNLIAPILTTSLVLKRAKHCGIKTVITNVSSGAAGRSTYGWSLYGSSKAGLNRYTETVALEQAELKTGHQVILFDPSIMDTNMQGDIRSTSPEAFQDVEQFKQYKADNKLSNTTDVANVLVKILLDDTAIINGKYYSIKDYL